MAASSALGTPAAAPNQVARNHVAEGAWTWFSWVSSADAAAAGPGVAEVPGSAEVPGFAEVLRRVRVQMEDLSQLVTALETQHDLEVARLGGKAAPQASAQASGSGAGGQEQKQEGGGGGPEEGEEGPDALFEAVMDQDATRVRALLQRGVDPNAAWDGFRCGPLNLTSSTPLATAVILQNAELVRDLVAAKADPNSQYSFVAGAELATWRGPALHACIPAGNLPLLEELLTLRADINAPSSNGANLLWQAAYFGQTEALEFLLTKGLDKEQEAFSQDDNRVTYTPVHIASKTGNAGAVRALLDAKADIDVSDGVSWGPLDNAVANGHADIVQLLVARGADLFKVHRAVSLRVEPRMSSLRQKLSSIRSIGDELVTDKQERIIDVVFASNNPALAAAVAEGLAELPELPQEFRRYELVRFLQLQGKASSGVWKAIFKRRALQHWQLDPANRMMRVSRRQAFMKRGRAMLVTLGPSHTALWALYIEKKCLPAVLEDFVPNLAPAASSSASDIFVPVTFRSCSIQNLTRDLQIIHAIAYTRNIEMFQEPGCCAVVYLYWLQAKRGAKLWVAMSFVQLCTLFVLSWGLREPSDLWSDRFGSESQQVVVDVATGLALVVWGLKVFIKIFMIVGYASEGLSAEHLRSKWTLAETVGMLLTGVSILWTLIEPARDNPWYRGVLGLSTFFEWARFVVSHGQLRQSKSVLMRILPLIGTMQDVWPLLAVMVLYLAGSAVLLYCLNAPSLSRAFHFTYYLALTGEEMTDVKFEKFDFFQIGFYFFVTSILSVFLMNLFIAVLCASYDAALPLAQLAFMKFRARSALDQHALHRGLQAVVCCQCRRQERRQLSRANILTPHTPNRADLAEDRLAMNNLWFTLPEQQ